MKTFKSLITAGLIWAICIVPVKAEEPDDYNGFGNPSQEEIELNEHINEMKSSYVPGDEIQSNYRMLNVPTYYQQEDNFCAPACVQMILKYLTGITYSQYTLANNDNLKTNNNGTIVGNIPPVLNSYISSSFNYAYETTSNHTIVYAFRASINQGYPCIANVQLSILYPGLSVSGNHYVVVKGFSYPDNVTQSMNSNTKYFTYIDPYNFPGIGGTHTVTSTRMNNSINGATGYYIW